MRATSFPGSLRLVKSLQRFLPNRTSKEVLHGLCWHLPSERAIDRYRVTNQRFRPGVREDLEPLAVHGSSQMKYDGVQLNSFSRPRDVLSDKVRNKHGDAQLEGRRRYMQRPSSRKNANPKGIGSPPSVANRGLIPPNPPLCLLFPQKCGLGHAWAQGV